MGTTAGQVGLAVEALREEGFEEGPLAGEPLEVIDHFLALGHATLLAVAPTEQRDAIVSRYVAGFERERRCGTPDRHVVLYARLRRSV